MNITNPWVLWALIIAVWAIITLGGYFLVYGIVQAIRAFM